MRKTTIHEIAALARVSSATVSRAIHSPHLLSARTLERIRRIMAENNYSYNAAAANLSKGISQGVAVVVPRIASTVWADTITGIQEHLNPLGYYVTVASSHFDPGAERLALERIVEQRPAGILLTGYTKKNEDFIFALSRELPLIVMWEKAVEPLNYVGFDNYQVTYESFAWLASQGHRRIAAIMGPFSRVVRAAQRCQGYLDFLKANDIPFRPEYLFEGEPELEDGRRAMEKLLALPERPTAVFCNNDLQAIAAIRVIFDAGLRVPEDISVCGFDNADVSSYITPPLTTRQVPCMEIGTRSAEFLHELIREHKLGPVRHLVETPLVIRESCQAPAA